jgi:hypothetical protein
MRHTALALMLMPLACENTPADPEPGSQKVYESCKYVVDPSEELCGEGLVCQGSQDPDGFYCAPACPTASEDIYSQSPDCPEIEGFVSYCGELSGRLSCIITCDDSCPDGLGLRCEKNITQCVGQGDS